MVKAASPFELLRVQKLETGLLIRGSYGGVPFVTANTHRSQLSGDMRTPAREVDTEVRRRSRSRSEEKSYCDIRVLLMKAFQSFVT